MAVDARAFVKPTFGFRGVHAHGNRVRAAEMRHVRYILAERVVTALMMSHAPTVDPHRCVAEHTVECQPDTFASVFLWQFKRAAVPGDAVRRVLSAQRFETVAAVGGP